jgi:hypothetical protein
MVAFLGVAPGCSGMATSDSAELAPAGAGAYYPPPAGAGGTAGGGSAGTGGSSLPPEQELESAYEFPTATGRYVWVANPVSGRVAFVDAASLVVQTTEAGQGPTYLAAVPDPAGGADAAIVLNVGSRNATLLRADAKGLIDAVTLPVAEGSNTWAIEGQGHWAIAWTDGRNVKGANVAQGFQDLSVLRLDRGSEKATRVSVGYRPVAVSYSADARAAYVVTQDGISVVDLAAPSGPAATKLVAIGDDPMQDPGTRDVAITPDGTWALVRRDGSKSITLVDIASGARAEVVLPGPVTDLDLSPDGTAAVAVVRDTSQAAVLPIPAVASEPHTYALVPVEDAVVGSVVLAGKAKVGLLYSNASAQERITRLDYASPPAARTLKLHAPVLAVFLAPDGTSAVVLHDATKSGSDAGPVGSAGAFSVLGLSPELPAKIVAAQAPPSAVAITTSGDRAVVAERDDAKKLWGAYLVRMGTQQVDRYELASPPIAVGALQQARRAFVAQKHPDGRITFVDLDSGMAKTLTGFELGSRVVDGTGK